MISSNPLAGRIQNLDTYLFVAARQRGQKTLGENKSLIDLSVGDPDVTISAGFLRDAFSYALKNSAQSHLYPPNKGSMALRQAVAAWMRYRFGARLDPDTEIGILNGSKEGLAHLAMTLYNPGDQVLMGELTYPVYKRSASLAGAKVVLLPMPEKNGYQIDFGHSKQSGKKVLILNYPNNPTGAMAPLEYFKEAVRWAKKNGAFIISDTAYSEIFNEKHKPPVSIFEVPGASDVAVEFHSFSKSFGLAGLRLAWVCGNAQVIAGLYKLKDTYDSGVNNFSQSVGEFILNSKNRDQELSHIRGSYAKRREIFEEGLRKGGLSYFASPATFYVWVKQSGGQFIDDLLYQANILAVPGAGFGKPGNSYTRFALCRDTVDIKEAVRRIRALKG